jgi:hypothetical protein
LRKNRQDGAAVRAKGRAVRAFTAIDDFVYIGFGVLLGVSALALLGRSVVDFWQGGRIGHGWRGARNPR